jgi:acetyltransferase-like isoleucine patch superfamily enzyme
MNIREIVGEWDYAGLPGNIHLGEACYLERQQSFAGFRSTRNPGLRLGKGVKVYGWTSFNVEPSGVLEIGDGSTLLGATFYCADHIRIGRRVVISQSVIIADCDLGPPGLDSNELAMLGLEEEPDDAHSIGLTTGPVVIGDDVWIGIGAIILKDVTIGEGARIAAGAVVTASVPPKTWAVGNPARIFRRR